MPVVDGPPAQGRVIELDVAAEWEPSAGRPWRAVPGRRWLALPAVLLTILSTVAGSTWARPLGPVFQLTADVRQIVSAPGLLVALVHGVSSEARLRAYRTGDFTVAWEVPVTGDDVGGLGDVLVVSLRSDPDAVQTRVLDAATGRDLWRRRDMSVLGRAGDVVVVTGPRPGGTAAVLPTGLAAPEQAVIGVDRRTGDVRWSTSTPGNVDVRVTGRTPTGDISGLVEIGPAGQLRVRDVATGAVRSSSRVPMTGESQAVAVLDDLVVVGQGSAEQSIEGRAVRGFGIADGRLRWERVSPPDQFLNECGAWLCESGPAGIATIDPGTGQARWQSKDRLMWQEVVGDRGVVTTGGPAYSSELTVPGIARTRLAVVDMRTGRIEREISGWEPMSGVLPDVGLLVGQANRRGDARVGVLDLASGRLSLIGTVTVWSGGVGAPVGCVALERLAACQAGLEMAVWRLPSAAGR